MACNLRTYLCCRSQGEDRNLRSFWKHLPNPKGIQKAVAETHVQHGFSLCQLLPSDCCFVCNGIPSFIVCAQKTVRGGRKSNANKVLGVFSSISAGFIDRNPVGAQHSSDDCLKSDRFKCVKVCKPYSCGMLDDGLLEISDCFMLYLSQICWQKTISEHCCTVGTQCVTICDRQTKECTFEYSRQMSKMASNAAQWQSCDSYRWPCPAAFTWLVHLCTVLSKAQPHLGTTSLEIHKRVCVCGGLKCWSRAWWIHLASVNCDFCSGSNPKAFLLQGVRQILFLTKDA